MHVVHCLQDLPHVDSGLVLRKVPVRILLYFLVEFSAGDYFDDHVVPVFVSEVLVHFDDVGVVQAFVDFDLVFQDFLLVRVKSVFRNHF